MIQISERQWINPHYVVAVWVNAWEPDGMQTCVICVGDPPDEYRAVDSAYWSKEELIAAITVAIQGGKPHGN